MKRLQDAMTIAMVYNVFTEGSAIIAGGCLRDLETGRDPKDVDILIEWESKADYREAEIMADRLGYTAHHCNETYGDNEDGQLRTVYKLTKAGKKPIDLIFLNCPVMERIENFPCNAAMVWLDKGIIRSNASYGRFMNSGKLEFYDTCLPKYKAKLLSYYPQG